MSRPEGSNAPELFYNASEAKKYNESSRMNNIQVEITSRCLEMMDLPKDHPSYLLDIGCGSGISSEIIQNNGHYWVGCDISRDMLEIANERENESGDLVCHDMGLGLPFRPGSFDGVISVSAIQWLCYSNSNDQDPKLRLNRFFGSLYAVMRRHAKAILQFYPETAEQALLISQCASKVGFAGGIVVDYPNSSKAKKFYLCLSFERTYQVPQGLDDGAMITNASANSQTQQQNMIVSRSSSGSRKGKAKKAAFKSKEWIVAKKSRMQMQGKVTKTDSKYTGRKRKSRF